MALIYCSECGKQISDQSRTCPHCGAPRKQGAGSEKEDSLGCLMWGVCFLFPIVGIIYYFVVKGQYPQKAKSALTAAAVGFVLGLIFSVATSL